MIALLANYRWRWLAAAALLSLVVALAGPAVAWAAEPPLAAWVPASAGLTIEVTGAAPAARQFLGSPLGRRWLAFPPVARWWGENREQTGRVVTEIGRYLGVAPADVWRDVLGHQALLAVWPPRHDAESPPGNNDGPPDTAHRSRPPASTLLLLRSHNAATLRQLVEGFCNAQERSDQVAWQVLKHGEIEFRHGSGGKGSDLYVALLDNTAAVSDTRQVLETVLDLQSASQRAATSIADLPEYQAATAALPSSATVRLFVQAKVWTAALAADAARAEGQSRQEKEQFLALWRGVQSVNLVAQLGETISVQTLAQFNSEAWPSHIQELWQAVQGEATFANHMPADCLVAFAGRLDLPALLDTLQRHRESDANPDSKLGWQWAKTFLSVLGSEWGGYHASVPASAPTRVPLAPPVPNQESTAAPQEPLTRWVLATQLRDHWEGATPESPTPAAFLQSALPGMLQLLAANQPSVKIRVEQPTTALDVWVLRHPRWFGSLGQIAVTVADGCLWTGSSAETLGHALRVSPPTLALSESFKALLPEQLPNPSGFFYVNAAAARGYIETHGEALATSVAASRGIDAEHPRRGLEQLHALLQLFDRGLIATQCTRDAARLSLTIAADPPQESLQMESFFKLQSHAAGIATDGR